MIYRDVTDFLSRETLDPIYEVVRLGVGLLLIATYLWKIVVMNKNTKQWNGLGRALRLENGMYAAFWVWLIFQDFIPYGSHPLTVILIGLTIATVTIRVILLLPKVRIRAWREGDQKGMMVHIDDRNGGHDIPADSVSVTSDRRHDGDPTRQ